METTNKGRAALPVSWRIAKAVLIGILTTGVGLVLFALLLAAADLDASLATPLASIASGAGAFVAGLYLARKSGSRGLLHGLSAGGILFLLFSLVALAVDPGHPTLLTLLHAVILLLSSAVGGVIGVNTGRTRKII